MRTAIVAACLLALSFVANAACAQTELVVSWRASVSPAARAKLHRRFRTRLLYHSEVLTVDVVSPRLEKKGEELSYAALLCAFYRRQTEVTDCEVAEPPELVGSGHDREEPAKGHAPAGHEPVCLAVDTRDLKSPAPGLTPLWAQELIGADLARESLAAAAPAAEVKVGVIDGGYDLSQLSPSQLSSELWKEGLGPLTEQSFVTHAQEVMSLINGSWGKSPKDSDRVRLGSSQVARFSVLGSSFPTWHFLRSADAIVRQKPKLVNLSLNLHATPSVRRALDKMAENSILVDSAGNGYPEPLPPNEKGLRGILVGSLRSDGLVAATSSEGEEVTILAPGYQVLGSDGYGGLGSLRGTSFAAPLVTGALANLAALLPDFTLEEARTLLRRTAIPTLNRGESPQRNGAGTVNAFKLVEIGKRLKKAGWPTNRVKLLERDDLFDFSAAARAELEAGEAAERRSEDLAKVDEPKSREESCRLRREALVHFRKSFLLDPNLANPARKRLIEIYVRDGYERNAELYRSLEPEEARRLVSEGLRSDDGARLVAAIKSAKGLGREVAKDLFDSYLSESDLEPPRGTLIFPVSPLFRELVASGDDGTRWVAKLAKKHPEYFVEALVELKGADSLPLLEVLFKKAGDSFRQKILRLSARFGPQAMPLFRLGADSDAAAVRAQTATSLGAAGTDGLPLLKKLIRDDEDKVRAEAMKSAAALGAQGLPVILEDLKEDNPVVRDLIAYYFLSLELGGESFGESAPAVKEFLTKYLGHPETALPAFMKSEIKRIIE